MNARMLAQACGLALMLTSAAHAATPDARDVATAVLDQLDAGHYEAAAEPFTDDMRKAVPPAALQRIWTSLPAATGRGTVQTSEEQGMTVVVVPLHRGALELLARVAVTHDGHVAGLLVQPAPAAPAAPVAADANFDERPMDVGTGERALHGTLAMPHGSGPFPGVVLVHGSGPNDRDETVGANRPFLDIARGLAARGIAVLRYEKRTKQRPQDYANGRVDMDSETTDDAVAALAQLRGVAGIDPRRVFVFGHSQGAMLAPRIASRAGKVAGVVMLAAPARPLLDLLAEQNRFLAMRDGAIDATEQAQLDALATQIANARSTSASADAPTPLGLPASYWRAFDTVKPVEDAKSLTVTMLLLQGGRDIQVTATDWRLWSDALKGNKRATLRAYPALNHLGIAGTGPGTLEEYMVAGHVDATLIADVAAWVQAH